VGLFRWEFNVRIHTLAGGGLLLGLLLSSTTASAGQNPFVAPSGNISKAQVQAIIRAEIARQAAQAGGAASAQQTAPVQGGVASQMRGARPALPGSGAAAAIGSLPSQGGGAPTGVSTASGDGKGAASGNPNDPVSVLIAGGGQFVGCVSATPVFKDKDGRRAYFTSKELKTSNEARRIARCG